MKQGYITIIESDEDITEKVNQIFKEQNGEVPFKDFERHLYDRFGFSPIKILDESEIDTTLKKGLKVYPIVNGMVFQRRYN